MSRCLPILDTLELPVCRKLIRRSLRWLPPHLLLLSLKRHFETGTSDAPSATCKTTRVDDRRGAEQDF